jgi:DNA-binding NarL/FixJ family response regulator
VSRILVINDNAVAGPELQALLAREFHDVVLVNDAAGGILELASSRFDLVIVDIMRARMDGLALIARLRGLALKLPIICMTGVQVSELTRPSLEFSELATEAGATCCLRRPLDPRQLLEAVNSSPALSNNKLVARMQHDLSAEFSFKPKSAVLQLAAAPRELRNAFVALRHCVQELVHERMGDPNNLESVRDMATGALKATERLFEIIGPNTEANSAVYETAETIALNKRATNLNPALQRVRNTGSLNREKLTPREREVLALVTDGASNKVGGFRLSISVRTFEAHRAKVMDKLGAKNAAELVRFGLEVSR